MRFRCVHLAPDTFRQVQRLRPAKVLRAWYIYRYRRGLPAPSGSRRFFWEEDVESQPSPTDLAWAAGFFDGDGHVGLASGLQVELTQKYRLPLVRFRELLGPGTFYQTKRPYERNPSCLWELAYYGESGKRVLTALLPYLVAKRTEAELALQCYEACYVGRRGGRKRTPVEQAEVDSYREALVEYRHRPVEDE
jgi:hypothetical protein